MIFSTSERYTSTDKLLLLWLIETRTLIVIYGSPTCSNH